MKAPRIRGAFLWVAYSPVDYPPEDYSPVDYPSVDYPSEDYSPVDYSPVDYPSEDYPPVDYPPVDHPLYFCREDGKIFLFSFSSDLPVKKITFEICKLKTSIKYISNIPAYKQIQEK
jgi:hypothetical protein